MAYDPTNWVDGENKYSITDQAGNIIPGFENIKLLYAGIGGTPLSQEKMNHIEQGIYALHRVTGTYTGDGATSRDISLGFAPSAVLLLPRGGYSSVNSHYYGGFALIGHPVRYEGSTDQQNVLSVNTDGFTVYYDDYVDGSYNTTIETNKSGMEYMYIAFR